MRRRVPLAVACRWIALAVLLAARAAGAAPQVVAVGPIGFTVSDADRTAAFLAGVLDFEKAGDVEVAGPELCGMQSLASAALQHAGELAFPPRGR